MSNVTNRVSVIGNTFTRKERLKNLGGQWDAHGKIWDMPNNISAEHLREIASWPGVKVIDERKKAKPTFPKFIGDEQRYMGSFHRKEVTTFFGFSSLYKLIKYLETTPIVDHQPDDWDYRDYGTKNLAAALKLAKDGWEQGAEFAAEVSEYMQAETPRKPRSKAAVAGGSVNVGRMLAGNPKHMRLRTKQSGKKLITVFVDASASHVVHAETMIARAIGVAAMIDTLEKNGRTCEIVACDTWHSGSGADATTMQTAVTLKRAGEALNIHEIVFGLGHPSFLRRMLFSLIWTVPGLYQGWFGQSIVMSKVEPGEIYIDGLGNVECAQVRTMPMVDKALTLLSIIEILGIDAISDS